MVVTAAIPLLLSALLTVVAAETCGHGLYNIYCLFGCCETLHRHCCMNNGLGVGIIVGVFVIVLSIILMCIRRRRRRRYLSIDTGLRACRAITPGYTVAQTTTVHGQITTGYDQPFLPYPTAPPTTYEEKPSGY